jgi:hypothetical protein
MSTKAGQAQRVDRRLHEPVPRGPAAKRLCPDSATWAGSALPAQAALGQRWCVVNGLVVHESIRRPCLRGHSASAQCEEAGPSEDHLRSRSLGEQLAHDEGARRQGVLRRRAGSLLPASGRIVDRFFADRVAGHQRVRGDHSQPHAGCWHSHPLRPRNAPYCLGLHRASQTVGSAALNGEHRRLLRQLSDGGVLGSRSDRTARSEALEDASSSPTHSSSPVSSYSRLCERQLPRLTRPA